MAMLANFSLSKEKIQSKINAIPIKKRATWYNLLVNIVNKKIN